MHQHDKTETNYLEQKEQERKILMNKKYKKNISK